MKTCIICESINNYLYECEEHGLVCEDCVDDEFVTCPICGEPLDEIED